MIGRQLPFLAVLLPLYVMALHGGMRSGPALWPMLLVAGGSFAVAQFVSSNYLDYALTDVFSSLTALIVTLAFLRIWSPAFDPAFAVDRAVRAHVLDATVVAENRTAAVPGWQGWIPWVVVSAAVIVWTHLKVFAIGQQTIPWPGLHNTVAIALHG